MDQLLDINLDSINLGDAAHVQVALLVVGALYAFAGHRLLRLVIGLTGFLLAGAVAGVFGAWLSHGNVWILGGFALLGGVCGAMALFFLYRAGIFAIGGLGMAVLLHGALIERPETWIPWAILGGAIAGGLVAVFLERPVIILATAIIGSWLMTYAGAYLLLGEALRGELSGIHVWLIMGSWAALGLLGIAVQSIRLRPKRT